MADKLRAWLDEIKALAAEPTSPASVRALKLALAKRPGHVVALAAQHVADHDLRSLVPDLVAAWSRLAADGAKSDAGCPGKLGIVDALAAFDHPNPDVFLEAVAYVQLEKSWGPPVDTAVNVRGHGLAALVSLREPGTPDLIALCLADPEPRVRAAAARCAGDWGNGELGRALLLYAVLAEEREPEVLAEALDSLVRLGATARVVALLSSANELVSEAAALALGAAKLEVEALIAWCKGRTGNARKVGLVAVGLTRSAAGLEYLLGELTARGAVDDVLEALEVYRADPALEARIEEVLHQRR